MSSTSIPIDSGIRATKYTDFSKSATDFFVKDFPSGQIKVEAKTAPRSLFTGALKGSVRPESFSDEFKITSIRNLDNGQVSAEVKSTSLFQLFNKVDTKSVTTLNTGNVITQQFTLYNPLLEGLKLDVCGGLRPAGGIEQTKVGLEFSQPTLYASTYVDILRGGLLTTDISTRIRDVQFGGDLSLSPSNGQLQSYTVGVSLDRPREKISIQALNGINSFLASYHQRFNEQMEVAYRAEWNAKSTALTMEVGAKYNLFTGGFLKAKIDNFGKLGLSLASDLRSGLQVTLGASIDTNKLSENQHRFGLDLTYTA